MYREVLIHGKSTGSTNPDEIGQKSVESVAVVKQPLAVAMLTCGECPMLCTLYQCVTGATPLKTQSGSMLRRGQKQWLLKNVTRRDLKGLVGNEGQSGEDQS